MHYAPKILIAEDDKVQLHTMAFYLEKCGYRVIRVNNGLEAKQEIRNGGFDMVITDVNMPYMDGIEVLQYAKNRNKMDFQAIVLSSNSMESTKHRANEAGAEFISKPVNLAALARSIEGLLLSAS